MMNNFGALKTDTSKANFLKKLDVKFKFKLEKPKVNRFKSMELNINGPMDSIKEKNLIIMNAEIFNTKP